MKSLKEKGYCIIDILNSEDVQYLNSLCEKYLNDQQGEFISSSHFLDKASSDFINEELHKILKNKMESLFPNLELLGGTLGTKKRGRSVLEAHQDWSIVDESIYESYNLWIPLVDTNKINGTLGLVEGSHLWFKNVRGYNIPNPFCRYTKMFLKIGDEPALKAGQAILYDHRLIHFSRANKSNVLRNVAIIGMKPKTASLELCFKRDFNTIEVYPAKPEDFYKFDVEKIRKKYHVIDKYPFKNMEYTFLQIFRKIHKPFWHYI